MSTLVIATLRTWGLHALVVDQRIFPRREPWFSLRLCLCVDCSKDKNHGTEHWHRFYMPVV